MKIQIAQGQMAEVGDMVYFAVAPTSYNIEDLLNRNLKPPIVRLMDGVIQDFDKNDIEVLLINDSQRVMHLSNPEDVYKDIKGALQSAIRLQRIILDRDLSRRKEAEINLNSLIEREKQA